MLGNPPCVQADIVPLRTLLRAAGVGSLDDGADRDSTGGVIALIENETFYFAVFYVPFTFSELC